MKYYAVIDLEMCKVPKARRKGFPHRQETIQIGAVLLNDRYDVIGKFCTYVKPEFGGLDGFIKRLTGITEEDLKEAPNFQNALNAFVQWLPEKVTAISWSESDKYQFIYELAGKGIKADPKFEVLLDSWIDCQPDFSKKMKRNKLYSLEEALIATDVFSEGRAHNGLDDAYNTALLYAKLQREEELILNPYYDKAYDDSEMEHLSYGLGEILAAAGF